MAETASTFRVAQVTDTHVTAHDDAPTVLELLAGIDGGDPMVHLRQVVDDIAALDRRPDRIIGTGDLADTGHPEAYRRWRALFEPLGIDTHVLPGNHDLEPAIDEHLVGGFVSGDVMSRHGDWLFLYVRTGNTEWGEIAPAHVEQLRAARAASDAHHVFVWIHHPPVGQHLAAHEALVRDDLAAVLEGDARVRGIAAGHVHVDGEHELDGVPVYLTPSTYTGRPKPGYRVFDFGPDGAIDTHVRLVDQRWTFTDADRAALVAMGKQRFAAAPLAHRGHAEPSRAEVEHWQALSLESVARHRARRG